jgi:prepilin-type N-terminal cleavage/methylation domain-containing protein
MRQWYLFRHNRKSKAFSLVELSIVLVILGLLVGGILGGQALIRASELRTITTEFQRYITAMAAFRDKYFYLPGDFDGSGYSMWGKSIGYGNLNGAIENSNPPTNEIGGFWAQLGQTGLLEGSYSASASGTTLTAGTNNPRSKVGNAAWNIGYLGDVAADGTNGGVSGGTDPAATAFFVGSYGHALLFGSGSDALLPGGVLKSEEAWNIDTKMDDGRPERGSLRTLESQGSGTDGVGCSKGDTSTAAFDTQYDLGTASNTACSLVFGTGF